MLRSKLRLIGTGVLATAFLLNLGASPSFSARAQRGTQNGLGALTRRHSPTASTAGRPLTRRYSGQGSPVIQSIQPFEGPGFQPPTAPQGSSVRAPRQHPSAPIPSREPVQLRQLPFNGQVATSPFSVPVR